LIIFWLFFDYFLIIFWLFLNFLDSTSINLIYLLHFVARVLEIWLDLHFGEEKEEGEEEEEGGMNISNVREGNGALGRCVKRGTKKMDPE